MQKVKAQETRAIDKKSQFVITVTSLDTIPGTADQKSNQITDYVGHWP